MGASERAGGTLGISSTLPLAAVVATRSAARRVCPLQRAVAGGVARWRVGALARWRSLAPCRAAAFSRVLGRVAIPHTVASIDAWAFECCVGITHLDFQGNPDDEPNTAAVQRDAPGDAAEGADARTQDYLATGGALTCIGPRKSGNTSRTWVIVSSSLAHLHTYPACPTGGGVVHRTRTWADGTGPPLTDR